MRTQDLEFLKKLLILHEGLRLKPYKCTSGKLTIGVGRNLDDVGLSEDEAYYLLNNDIKKVLFSLSNQFKFFDQLSPARKVALADLCFNVGLGKLLQFKNTLAYLEQKKYKEAAEALLQSKYAKQVGLRAKRIAAMIDSGEFPHDV